MKEIAVFIVLTSVISSCIGVFDRNCSSGCGFEPKGSNARQDLSCTLALDAPSKCACDRDRYMADVASWDLEMVDGKCLIALSGPCGEDNGLEIGCHAGNECIEGLCRDPLKLGKTSLDNWCSSTIDCESGLECKEVGFYYMPITRCVKP